MFNAPGARGTWPEELRLPAEAALAVRYACEADALRFVPLLYTLARSSLTRCAMPTRRLDGLLEEAERAAHADLVTGLDGLVQEAAAATKDDVVLHALHVACGAAAVDAVRRSGPEHPPTCCCPSCDEPDRLRDRPPPDMPITIPDERAWCERVSGRARAGAYASVPIVGVIDGKPVPVRGST